jgi:hypothetical protein
MTQETCVQIDLKGKRERAQVTRYDSLRVRHEVQFECDDRIDGRYKAKAWIDLCRDTVYKECDEN